MSDRPTDNVIRHTYETIRRRSVGILAAPYY